MFCLPKLIVHIIHALILFFMICGVISRSKKPHMNGQLMQNCFILDEIGIFPTTNSHYVCVFISDQKWSTNNAWPGLLHHFAFIPKIKLISEEWIFIVKLHGTLFHSTIFTFILRYPEFIGSVKMIAHLTFKYSIQNLDFSCRK